jgi:hypothetical protein
MENDAGGRHGDWIEKGWAWRVDRGGCAWRVNRGVVDMESGLRGVGTETRSRRGGHGVWIEEG